MATAFFQPVTQTPGTTILVGDVNGVATQNIISDTTVSSKLLTGFVANPGSTITAADTIRGAIGKLAGGQSTVSTNFVESIGTTLNIASSNQTQVLNLGSGTTVQTINVGNSGVGATAINIGGGLDVVSFGCTLLTSAIESTGTTLNIASKNTTQVLNIGSGSGVQAINIGKNGPGVTTINIGGVEDIVNIAGTVNATNLQVANKSLILNAGGSAGSSGTSGIYFEEAGVNATSYVRVAAGRSAIEMKPYNGPLITLNQSLQTTDSVTFSSEVITGSSTIGGTMGIAGATTIGGTLVVAGASTLGATTVGGNFAVTGNSVFNTANVGTLTVSGNSALSGTLNVTGIARLSNMISLNNQIQNKMFSLYEDVTSPDQTRHDFYGFGIAPYTLRYQVDNTTSNHVFYAGTSATTSNTLMTVAGNGAVTIPGTLAITGRVTASNVLGMGSAQNKMISLFEDVVSSDQTRYDFYGFGIGVSSLRYQVDAIGASHVFSAATSATSSNTLMSVNGNGLVTIPGLFSMNNQIKNKVLSFYDPNGVNNPITLDQTRYDFTGIGLPGGNSMRFQICDALGGFAFSAASSATVAVPLMNIASSGNTSIFGGLRVNANGLGQSFLSNYIEQDFTTTFGGGVSAPGPATSPSITMKITQVGRLVTLFQPAPYIGITATNSTNSNWTTAIELPSQFWPAVVGNNAGCASALWYGTNAGASVLCQASLYSGSGFIYLTTTKGGNWSGSMSIKPWSMTWSV